jgi:putative endonuclease
VKDLWQISRIILKLILVLKWSKMETKLYYVYILTNKCNSVFYTGVTNNLERRCYEHKKKLIKGFTSKYNVDKLVYYEVFDMIIDAIAREKQIKGYTRIKKKKLIENFNNNWDDLNVQFLLD